MYSTIQCTSIVPQTFLALFTVVYFSNLQILLKFKLFIKNK